MPNGVNETTVKKHNRNTQSGRTTVKRHQRRLENKSDIRSDRKNSLMFETIYDSDVITEDHMNHIKNHHSQVLVDKELPESIKWIEDNPNDIYYEDGFKVNQYMVELKAHKNGTEFPFSTRLKEFVDGNDETVKYQLYMMDRSFKDQYHDFVSTKENEDKEKFLNLYQEEMDHVGINYNE